MSGLKVIKVEAEGPITSFRYPHFMVGRQISFPAPPPATIYGHLCSALGDHIPRDEASIAYCFESCGEGDDLETAHFSSVASGRLDRAWGYVKNIDVQTNVLKRQLLLNARLTLYLHCTRKHDAWMRALREPEYPVVLGRSQDLFAYRSVQEVDLTPGDQAYLGPGVLPWEWRAALAVGESFQMPRFVDPASRSRVEWSRYVVLSERVWWGDASEAPRGAAQALRRMDAPALWIDPTSPPWAKSHRAVVLHRWTDS